VPAEWYVFRIMGRKFKIRGEKIFAFRQKHAFLQLKNIKFLQQRKKTIPLYKI